MLSSQNADALLLLIYDFEASDGVVPASIDTTVAATRVGADLEDKSGDRSSLVLFGTTIWPRGGSAPVPRGCMVRHRQTGDRPRYVLSSAAGALPTARSKSTRSAWIPATTVGYAEKVRSQFLSLRQPNMRCRTSWASGPRNPAYRCSCSGECGGRPQLLSIGPGECIFLRDLRTISGSTIPKLAHQTRVR
jgi:hypothetical protein